MEKHSQKNISFNPADYEGFSQDLKAQISIEQDRKKKRSQIIQSRQENRRSYHWNAIEQKRYINFLANQRGTFQSSTTARRLAGVHLQMAQLITSRTSKQCKSHHQKMLKKYGSVEAILQKFNSLLEIINVPKQKEEKSGGQESELQIEQILEIKLQKIIPERSSSDDEKITAYLTPYLESDQQQVQDSWSLLVDFE